MIKAMKHRTLTFRTSVLVVSFIAPTLGALPASANEVTGTIRYLAARASDGLHIVELNAVPTARPPCAAVHPYYMIKDETSDVGKSQFAMLMSAYLTNRPVRITGLGTCTRWGDGEDIQTVEFRN